MQYLILCKDLHSRALHSPQIRPFHAKIGSQCEKLMRIRAAWSEVWIFNHSGYPTVPFGMPGHKCGNTTGVYKWGRFSRSRGNRSRRGFGVIRSGWICNAWTVVNDLP
ncbi:hypothetical protein AVEN_54144-1 [Araneus ventricosus]|uniref:Uncharacterized protein n=1 Tax=Araneus ventricosus TaxID=182803 RepID=A0A4Y2BW75_ARAVE|nr:hypothetical protein AVEN_54144-1 [Araneus ventricosus]